MRLKFTDVGIRQLPFSERQTYYWDEYSTLGLRVGKRTKTFIVIGTHGKRLTLGKYPHLSLLEARRTLEKLKYAKYLDPASQGSPSASSAVQQFMELHAANTRPSSRREFNRILNKHFLPTYRHTPLNLITPRDILGITDKLLKTPASALATHTVLRTFFNWCIRRQLIERSPLAGLKPPAKLPSRDRVLSDVELAAVLKAALKTKHTPYGMIVLILAFTGLRKTEAHTLTWSRIDDYTITIPKELTKNKVELRLPNTIRDYLEQIPKTQERLFPKQIHWPSAKSTFDILCGADTWNQPFVLHDLRRTLSTKMAEWQIAPPDVVEAILNHISGSRSPIQRTYDRASRFPMMQEALTTYRKRLEQLIEQH